MLFFDVISYYVFSICFRSCLLCVFLMFLYCYPSWSYGCLASTLIVKRRFKLNLIKFNHDIPVQAIGYAVSKTLGVSQ
jgi:hypothetical protein